MTTFTQDRELLGQALEDLCSTFGSTNIGKKNRTIAALRARLAQPDAIGVTGGEVASVHLDGGGRPTLEAQTLRDIANAYFGDERDIECCLVAMRRAMELVALGLEAAARKSGDMVQGEQSRIKYLELLVKAYGPKSYQYDVEHPNDGLNGSRPFTGWCREGDNSCQCGGDTDAVRASCPNWKAAKPFVIESRPAASTGAGQISTEEKYRWVTEQAIYQQEGSYGWYEVTIDAPLQEDIDVTPEKFDAMVCAQIAAAQPKGDGNG